MPKETKKTSTKKKATKAKAASTKKPSKASLVTKLKEAGILVPEDADVATMEHRLKFWKEGHGYMVRIHRNAGSRFAEHPLILLDSPRKALYWLPPSEMTDKILATRRVVVVGRSEKPSSNMVVIDVPTDYETRFA
tara:strand:+ start:2553 stop:2960 length:408 start_codon:yes stop_codon:yes gene_type:complete